MDPGQVGCQSHLSITAQIPKTETTKKSKCTIEVEVEEERKFSLIVTVDVTLKSKIKSSVQTEQTAGICQTQFAYYCNNHAFTKKGGRLWVVFAAVMLLIVPCMQSAAAALYCQIHTALCVMSLFIVITAWYLYICGLLFGKHIHFITNMTGLTTFVLKFIKRLHQAKIYRTKCLFLAVNLSLVLFGALQVDL